MAAPRADLEVVADKKQKPPFGTSADDSSRSSRSSNSNGDDDDGIANGRTSTDATAENGQRQRWIGRSLLLSPSGATSSDGLPSADAAASHRMWAASAHPAAVSFPPSQPSLVRRWSVDSNGRQADRRGEENQRKRRPVMISFSASSDGENDADDGTYSVVKPKGIP